MLLARKIRMLQVSLSLAALLSLVMLGVIPAGFSSGLSNWLGWLGVALIAVGGFVGVFIMYRRYLMILSEIHNQIRHFMKTGQVGLIMLDTHDELAGLINEVNKYLTHIKFNFQKERQVHKELSLRASVAETEKRQAEAVIYSISEAVIVTDRYNELVLANETAQDLFDFNLEKQYRQTLEQVIDWPAAGEIINDARSRGRITIKRDYRHPVTQADYNLKIFSSAIRDDNDEIIGVVMIVHDVTSEQELVRLKDDFVSCVSHELKTPLASIQAYAEMLTDHEAGTLNDQRRFCDIIQNQADQLNRLIDDILNISRIEAGVASPLIKSFDLVRLVDEIINILQPQLDGKKLQLNFQKDEPEMIIQADRDLLFHAIINLVSNAVKYSPESAAVAIRLQRDSSEQVHIEVEDQGEGIPIGMHEQIFEKFYRVSQSTAVAGTGLGLHVAREIVNTLHGGSLAVRSEPGKGSCFRISLPQPPVPVRTAAPIPSLATQKNGEKL